MGARTKEPEIEPEVALELKVKGAAVRTWIALPLRVNAAEPVSVGKLLKELCKRARVALPDRSENPLAEPHATLMVRVLVVSSKRIPGANSPPVPGVPVTTEFTFPGRRPKPPIP